MKRIIYILLILPLLASGQDTARYITNGAGKMVVHKNQRIYFYPYIESSSVPSHWAAIDSVWAIAEAQYITTDVGVSQWDDISGQDNHFVQATTVRQPTYANDTVGFDGINHAIKSAVTISQPCVIYAVINLQSYLGSARIFELNGSNAYFGFGVSQGADADSTEWRMYAGTFYNSGSSGKLPIEQFMLLRIEINGASSEVQFNDHTPYTGDAGTNGLTEIDICDEGPGTTTHPEIAIKEIVVLAGTESGAEQTASETYFNDKYTIW